MEDQFLNKWLEDQYQEASKRVQHGQHKHEDLTIIMLKHQTNHIAHLETDLRGEIKSLRVEMHAEIKSLRTEMHAEINSLRAEMHAEIKNLRDELRGEIKELRMAISAQTWKMITALGFFTAIVALLIKL